MTDPRTVTLSLEDYLELVNDQNLLAALQNAGVDNWEGYDYAMELYNNND